MNGGAYQSGTSFTGLAANTYTVTAVDTNGCIVESNSVAITQPSVLIITANPAGASCGQCNGSVSLAASGGQPPYTITTSLNTTPVCTAISCDSLCPGAYNTILVDSAGCIASDSFEITTQPTITIDSLVIFNALCYGGNSGSACVYSSAPGAANYAWNTGDTTACVEHLAAGIYTVRASEAGGCSVTSSCTINQPAQLVSQILNSSRSSSAPDSITLSVSGGTIPYTINWNDGAVDTNISDTDEHNYYSAGDFIIQISDAKRVLVC